MKRKIIGLVFLLGCFVLGLVACGQEPETVTVEVTRIVEVEVPVEVTRVVEVEVEVLVTPEPSEAQLAAEAFAADTGLGEAAFDVLAGTHPTVTYLLVEHYLPEVMVTPDDGGNPVGAQAYCTKGGNWGEWIMRFDDLNTATVGHMTEPNLGGWIFLYGEFTRLNSAETQVGTGWVFGPYIEENYGSSWTPELVADPVDINTVSDLPGCELATAMQPYNAWDDATAAYENMEDAGTVTCETRSRYLVGADTYVSVICTTEVQSPIVFQFQNEAPQEINALGGNNIVSYELTWVFSADGIAVATGGMIAFGNGGRMNVQFPDLRTNEYWISRD